MKAHSNPQKSSVSDDFQKTAKSAPCHIKQKPLAPITLRLSEKELAKLNHLSNGMSRSAYIRKILFGNPRIIKQAFQDCWAISDSRAAFARALEERGYYLAKGDRRGHVAVDWQGEI